MSIQMHGYLLKYDSLLILLSNQPCYPLQNDHSTLKASSLTGLQWCSVIFQSNFDEIMVFWEHRSPITEAVIWYEEYLDKVAWSITVARVAVIQLMLVMIEELEKKLTAKNKKIRKGLKNFINWNKLEDGVTFLPFWSTPCTPLFILITSGFLQTSNDLIRELCLNLVLIFLQEETFATWWKAPFVLFPASQKA